MTDPGRERRSGFTALHIRQSNGLRDEKPADVCSLVAMKEEDEEVAFISGGK